MKYIFLIMILILSIFIYYKIITPSPYPSKYFEPESSKWHFFTKDKNIIKLFYNPSFFIKSIHLSGDFEEIKAIEVQSIAPFFIFKFLSLKNFSLINIGYGASFIKEKGSILMLSKSGKSFGWTNTKPEISFKLKKNLNFEFESIVEKSPKEGIFRLKEGFDVEIYNEFSPHFEIFFPKIEEIEIYLKNDAGFISIREKDKCKKISFGDYEFKNFKEEKLSLYLKWKENKFLKKYLNSPIFKNIKEIEIKCKKEAGFEKCNGYFTLNLKSKRFIQF